MKFLKGSRKRYSLVYVAEDSSTHILGGWVWVPNTLFIWCTRCSPKHIRILALLQTAQIFQQVQMHVRQNLKLQFSYFENSPYRVPVIPCSIGWLGSTIIISALREQKPAVLEHAVEFCTSTKANACFIFL